MSVSNFCICDSPQEHLVCSPCLASQTETKGKRKGFCPCDDDMGYHECPAKVIQKESLFLQRQLNELRRKCPNRRLGCQAVEPQSALDRHREQECEYRMQDCKCGEKIIAYRMPQHETDSCPEAMIDCPRAKRGCGSQYARGRPQAHEQECKYHACAYGTSGCRVTGTVADIAKHEKEYCKPLHDQVKLSRCKASEMADQLKRVSRPHCPACSESSLDIGNFAESASTSCVHC